MSISITSEPASTIAGLFRQDIRPVLLLGAGASVRSGIPISQHLVEAIAKWSYCATYNREFEDPTLMRTDWLPWLEQQAWFQNDVPLADIYPRAVEALLQPRENRKRFFKHILRPRVPHSPGYSALVRLLARKVIHTVLTTNFDQLLVSAANSDSSIYAIDEIKTRDDHLKFSTNPLYPQVVYLHGSIDHYTDKNIEKETNELDSSLVELLKPLLRDHPLIVVGYRGAEPSIMRHLLIQQRDACRGFRNGIYWCHLKDKQSEVQQPLVRELAAAINGNLRFIEIDSFDELMGSLDRALPELVQLSSPDTREKSIRTPKTLDLTPSERVFSDLNDTLLRQKLLAYADAARLPRPDLASVNGVMEAAGDRSLATRDGNAWTPTNGGVLLFARTPNIQLSHARVEVRLRGPESWIAEVLERPANVDRVGSDVEDGTTFTGDLWAQLERVSDLLARINKPFRLKGPTSQSAYPYPPMALKELLTNLLAHRDYSRREASQIDVTPYEIRFENAGGLVEHVLNQLENEDIQAAVSTDTQGIKGYRNPVIADFFYSAGAMDKKGSGLPDVIADAANNLNKVKFGPTADNGSFVATIQCRPEVLTLNTPSRTARSRDGELRYSPNLLTVTRWPEKVWKAATTNEAKEFGDAEQAGAPPFAVNRNWVWTFVNPLVTEAAALRPYILEEEVHQQSLLDLLGPQGAGVAVTRMLNMSLTKYLTDLGLCPKREGSRTRAYFPSLNGEAREITYQGLYKQATRTVTKPIVSRSTGRTIYWEHKAVSLRFERFGETWCLSLVPCYVFTSDGDYAPIAPDRIGVLSTKRAARDYNPSVLHDLVFWSRILAKGVSTSFEIPINSEKSAIEITGMLPTTVFQEEVDANMAATIEIEMSEEEQVKLQEEIEKIIEETSEMEQVDDDQSSNN